MVDMNQHRPACAGHATKLRRVSRFANRVEITTAIAEMEAVIGNSAMPEIPNKEQNHRRYKTLEWRMDHHDDWQDFMDCLRRGVPLVVKNSMKAFQRRYDFQYFARTLAGQTIKVIHILDGREEEKDAYKFFMSIDRGDRESEDWKIKDFPPRNAFKGFFESLAQDLDQNWAFRSYIAINGALNMMSRHPNNEGVVKGDVGPKIYNSPAIPEFYGKASTALHIDMMDAVNLSLFSAKSSQSSPQDGAAIWHIFPASSCEHIPTSTPNTKMIQIGPRETLFMVNGHILPMIC
ncbi:uncharacterized protein STEHIDRAFT_163969 [Stereum hirsutum FP-91666 SS1]|uniref:JmjC domain-containing protein n=1 Tax=Stereum hirsutum (strain FP-91666) TaxID=721885 RepID=R7RWH3_STEHR|nr:uncharacterized protein STEHIDRAFT_163969 [Stereum hirsutum FP-91666 SS1]EIM79145.1 hypothetical protein STEHIDRAFT_163969 [Stereum hirsutum FP-91666 SS1]